MIFLSHSSKNIKEAEYIYFLLFDSGLDVWFAPKSIEVGADYGEAIINAIEKAKIFILILSQDANNSDHILTEVEIAFKYKKIILPVRIEDVLPTKSLEYRLSTKQWVDLFRDFDLNLVLLLDIVKRKLQFNDKPEEVIQKKTPPKHNYSIVTNLVNIEKYLKQAIQIDRQYYSEVLVGVFETCMSWYDASNEIYTFVINDEDQVVAYFNAMLIDDDVFQTIKDGQFIDNDIPSDAIIDPFIPGIYHLYFCSMAIDKLHHAHKIEIFSLLYKSFFDKLNDWADKDFYIEEIIADAVTQDGKQISQSFGLTKLIETNHQSTLYYSKMLPPKFKGTKEAEKVFKKYKAYNDRFYY